MLTVHKNFFLPHSAKIFELPITRTFFDFPWRFELSGVDCTCHFETRPSPLPEIGGNAFGAHFLQLCSKNQYGDPNFLLHDFNKNSASFQWEKKWQKSMFSFLAILLNCTDWAITCRIARVQFNSTLERKVKTRALKGIFLVRKWINNTLKSNSVRYHMHHWKNLSFLSSFGLRADFVKGSKIAVFVSIVTSKQAQWPPLFITFLSSSWLVTSVYQVSSTIYVRFFYQGIILRWYPLLSNQ